MCFNLACQLVRAGGAALAVWSGISGLAISLVGYYNLLAINDPATWSSLEALSSPLSTAIARAVGHPVLANGVTPNLEPLNVSYTNLDLACLRATAWSTSPPPPSRFASHETGVVREHIAIAMRSRRPDEKRHLPASAY